MRVCVTGGAGYLGSVLIGRLLEEFEVDVWDNLMYGAAGILPHIRNPRFRLFIEDIRDGGWRENYPVIIHLAAMTGENMCNAYPQKAEEVNFYTTMAIADYARDCEAHLIYASTCSNYGVTEGLATEDCPLLPLGVYAETKVKAEKYIRDNVKDHTILRFPTLFGMSPRTRLDLMVNEWTRDAALSGKIRIYSPEAYRPHLYVEDATIAIETVILSHRAFNQTFNVGDPENNLTKRQLAEKIREHLPKTRITYVDKGDRRNYRVDFSKFNDAFNFGSYKSVDYGIDEVLRYLHYLVTKNTNFLARLYR